MVKFNRKGPLNNVHKFADTRDNIAFVLGRGFFRDAVNINNLFIAVNKTDLVSCNENERTAYKNYLE